MKVPYTDENCEKLAWHIAKNMDSTALVEFVANTLYSKFCDEERGEKRFYDNIEYEGIDDESEL